MASVEISGNSAVYRNNLLKTLYEDSLENEEETDVILVFGKFRTNAPSINVHSLILKSESSVFKDLMTAKVRNKESIKTANGKTLLSLQNDDYEGFKSFMKFLYGQKELIKKDQLHTEAIPAFKIAEKYKASNVLKVLRDDCFPAIIKDLDNLNVAEVMPLAQEFAVTSLVEAVLDHVKRKPRNVFLKGKNLANRSGEDLLVQLLSMDSYTLPRSQALEGWDRAAYDWSENERELAHLASLWLRKMLVEKDCDKSIGNLPPLKRPRHDTDVPLAVRVLQKIRFRQMNSKDLNQCLAELHTFLTPHQIGTILLVCSGISQNEISKRDGMEGQFIVDTKLRKTLQGAPNWSRSAPLKPEIIAVPDLDLGW